MHAIDNNNMYEMMICYQLQQLKSDPTQSRSNPVINSSDNLITAATKLRSHKTVITPMILIICLSVVMCCFIAIIIYGKRCKCPKKRIEKREIFEHYIPLQEINGPTVTSGYISHDFIDKAGPIATTKTTWGNTKNDQPKAKVSMISSVHGQVHLTEIYNHSNKHFRMVISTQNTNAWIIVITQLINDKNYKETRHKL